MKKTTPNIDELVAQAIREYKDSHKPKIEVKYGNTYVTVFEERHHNWLVKLFELMRLQYSLDTSHYYEDDGKIILNITGDNPARVEFIQNFINNGFRLNWE
jgi:hypothetical protein